MDGNHSSPIEPFDFEPEFQQKVMALVLRDQGLILNYRHMLRSAYFSDTALRQLMDWTLLYYDAYSIKPTYIALRHMITEYCAATPSLADHTHTLLAWADILYHVELADAEYVKSRLHEFVEEREYMLAVKKAIPKLKDKDKRKEIVNDILEAQANLAKTHGSLGVAGIGMDAETRTAYLFAEEIRDCIKSLWASFNVHCGGFGRAEMTVFAGSPNRGKSWALAHAAASALSQGFKVMFYTLEMSEKLILLRIYSILTGMTEDELKMNPQKLENAIAKFRALGGEIIVKQFHNAEIRDVREHLMGLQATNGWLPDMVVVDYADLLTQADIEVDRHVLRNIYKNLRDLAVQYNFAMVTASQLNRSADSKEKPTMADLAECYDKAAIADVIWMMCQTDEEIQQSRMRLFNAKNRNLERGRIVPLALQLSRGQLIDHAAASGPMHGSAPPLVGSGHNSLGGPTGPPVPPSLNANPFGN